MKRNGVLILDIRTLDKSDALAYRELRLEGLRTEASAFGSTYEREANFSLKEFEARIEPSEHQFTIGGFDDGTLVCTASFVRLQGDKVKHKGLLIGMYCSRSHRGTGMAEEVVGYLMDRIKKLEGLAVVNLAVVTENTRALSFYKKFGFRIYGTDPKAMYDGKRYYDENLMVLDLSEDKERAR
ncbi:GNAT family N-acetyltransferase [Salinicoccus roseus]|jgi:RimJ/RimL family protein N-acetyltransferase|uniref:GNAT family N-acetyltransferase n=1 Tax=Salinicoccus roseus TaxID=45670 RepID=UPI000F4E11BB|nr:GNAT family protein [Salinicoccus roseus]RPE51810.1 RimJ/RimL family protein N-acetyltransferase [Salinicoccus roseus]GGA75950.1 GNAT family N-acetyltransferase [Salinicoccus roseus]